MNEINIESNDDITLFTDEESLTVDSVNYEYHQESKFKGITREFTIFNDIQCYQKTSKKHGKKQKFRINLSFLNATPIQIKKRADKWFLASFICVILSGLFIYADWFSQLKLDSKIMMVLTAIGITSFLLSLLIGLLKSHDRIMYNSQYGNIPILELINHNPDKAQFESFTDALSASIKQAKEASNLTSDQRLPRELKEMRRLLEEKVISKVHYDQAKANIFTNKAFKSAGN